MTAYSPLLLSLKMIEHSEADARKGRTVPQEEVFKKIESIVENAKKNAKDLTRRYGFATARLPRPQQHAEMYMPYEQHPLPSTSLRIVARTDVPPENLFDTFQRVARSNAPEMPVRFTTMEARLSDNISAPRFRTLLLSIFAVLAVALAVAGIYAVVSFVVNQRISEIGLRMALGAASRDVLAMVLSEGLRMALVGLVLGLAGAFAVTRLFSTLLFKVEPTDTVTYVVAIVLVALVTLSASYLPARRAAQVDPSVALRHE